MNPRATVLTAIVLCSALYLPYLGSIEPRGEEPRRILPARTMIESGDWIVPKIGGAVYQKKPPLINWSIAAAFLVTGTRSDWAARLPSVLWLTSFVVTAALALRRRFGETGALSTGLFFVTTLAMMDKGRTAEIEAMYAAQTGIAFVLWAVWWSEGKLWRAYTIPWIFLGLGMLTKGPVHLALFYGTAVPALVFSRRLKELLSLPHLTGLLLMAAVFLPWTLLNLQLTGDPGKTTGVWAGEAAERIRFADLNWKSWLLRPVQVAGDLLPWTPLLILTWWQTRSLPGPADRPPEAAQWDHVIRGAGWGVVFGLAVLLLLPHGSARYCQPLFPALFLWTVHQFNRLGEASRSEIDRQWAQANLAGGWLAFVVMLSAAVAVPLLLQSAWLPGGLAALVCLAIALLPHLPGREKSASAPLLHTCLVMAGFAGGGLLHAGVYMDQKGDLRQNGRTMASLFPDPDRPLIFYKTGYFRSLLYVRRPYRELNSGTQLRPGPAYLVMPEKELASKSILALQQSHVVTEMARPIWEERKLAILRIDPKNR
jgi:4-amino-4-deoxy-L-arabinose transferase-like glycosyltransferase